MTNGINIKKQKWHIHMYKKEAIQYETNKG